MDKEQLFQARTNPDFLKYLEEARVNSIKEENIALMYETLDSMLVLDLEEEKINELYEQILKTSFEKVQSILDDGKKLDLKGDNLLYVRALFEHAIEKWSFDNFDGAKELFFILVNIVDDEVLQKALNVLSVVSSKKQSLDEFYESKVDLNKGLDDEVYGYFIVNFNFDEEKFLEENEATLKKEYENLKHLLED